MYIYTALRIKILIEPVNWLFGPDSGGQATFYGAYKITVLIWPVCFGTGLSALDAQKVNRIQIQKSNFCFKDLLSYFYSVVSQIIFS